MKVRLQSIVLTAGVLLVSPLGSAAGAQAASQAPAIRQIPGLTSKDAYPNGVRRLPRRRQGRRHEDKRAHGHMDERGACGAD